MLLRAVLLLQLVSACRAAAPEAEAGVIAALSNVKGALRRTYDLKDSAGLQMASLHLLPHTEGASPAQRTYHAAYMSMLPKAEWEVRVANSSDLIHWQFHRKILPNADMPCAPTQHTPVLSSRVVHSSDARVPLGWVRYAFEVKENGWILLAHEQWMRTSSGPSSAAPSRLGFKL